MENYYKYHFEVKHDSGHFFTSVVSYKRKNATTMLIDMENCPKKAITYIRKERIII
jgi:hypothetical protein